MPKISNLAPINAIASDDEIAINDASGPTTKKITVAQLLGKIYPIGSIYTNGSVNTNPADLLGFGTWEAFAAGRVPVGVDAGQTEFDVLGETGGAKTHTHPLSDSAVVKLSLEGTQVRATRINASFPFNHVQGLSSAANQSGTATFGVGMQGASDAGSTLQPYVTVCMWRRTA